MATKQDSKGQIVALAKQMIAGVDKHLAKTTPVAFMGGSFTPDQIMSNLQMLVNLRSDVNSARAATVAKLAVESAQAPALRTFMSAFASFVKVAYGTSPDVLADFGIAPKARTPLTVEAKAAAAAKRAATRAARHTMGSKQKKGIKGDVTGIILTPVKASSPTVAAPSSPAPTATSTGTTPLATSNGTTAATTPHSA
jgi:hypothetical protein